ncbi:FAD dependent oxidoreductase-domain-containing protein [Abortiporus biennis]|nr:FAD dependent oxidoreductase-domain-containing protein [Abortiporus biennis]
MPSDIVILGGGIIGLSTAYYLSQFTSSPSSTSSDRHPSLSPSDSITSPSSKVRIHIVDPSPELFASASGKAGGFLAKDWFKKSVLPLGGFSFDLHRKLAEEFNGREKWGWSESVSYSMDRENECEVDYVDDEEDLEEDSGVQLDNDDDKDQLEPILEEGLNVSATLATSPAARVAAANVASVISSLANMGRNTPSPTPSDGSNPDWLANGSSRTSAASSSTGGESIDCSSPFKNNHKNDPNWPKWIRARRSSLQAVTDKTTTAQVDPLRLCQFLYEECLKRGVIMHHPVRVTELLPHPSTSPDGRKFTSRLRLEHLTFDANGKLVQSEQRKIEDITCDTILLSAGCWTPKVYQTLFPKANKIPQIKPLAGYSVVMRSKRWPPPPPSIDPLLLSSSPSRTSVALLSSKLGKNPNTSTTPVSNSPPICHAIFTSDPSGFSPEIFSRAGGEIWLGGLNSSSIPLPEFPTNHIPSPSPLPNSSHHPSTTIIFNLENSSSDPTKTLKSVGRTLCGPNVEFIKEGLCFRPVTPNGKPVIAKINNKDLLGNPSPEKEESAGLPEVYVATGHGPWGITMSLGTGYVMAEMILGKEPSVDVKSLSKWEATGRAQ